MATVPPPAMLAVVQASPRAELELRTVPVPRPDAGDVLVRVAASTVHVCLSPALSARTDMAQSLDFKILRYGIIAQEWPLTGGNEFAGTVVAVGRGVENLQVNDRIIASAAGFIEGNQVSGWQQFALVHADLCTKIPDSLSFPLAATVPTSFVTASIALALDLGLKYPDPPPPRSSRKTAASAWATAMASLKGGAEFGFDLEDGVVEGGSWYPSETTMNRYANCLGINGPTATSHLPTIPSSTQNMPERERKRVLDVERHKVTDRTFRLSADDNGLAPVSLSYAPASTARSLATPRYSGSTRALEPIDLVGPWGDVHPMSWGTGDLSREAMDRRLGSGWNERAPRFVEVTNAPRLVETSSTSGSSTSSGMGRSGSDESYTSIEETLSSTKGKTSARRGSEPAAPRGSEPASLRRGSGSGSGLVRGTAPRANANAGANPRARGSTSPFRVPAAVSKRQGSPPYTYRARELSPVLSVTESRSGETGAALTRPVSAGATRPASAGATVPARRPMSALEELIYHGQSAAPVRPTVHAMDEPILIWGGATSVGRNALQLLKRAGYTNVFAVASIERHAQLAKVSPSGTRFFDYRDPKIVPRIQSALGERDLKKVLDCVSLPHTLKLVGQLVSPGATVAALLPVQTPMPDGVELRMTRFSKCHGFDGKDVAGAAFGREKMWPLLGEMLRAGEYVFPEMVHLRGGMQACATSAVGMMTRGENIGKRLVFDVPGS
ncbi:hypothetical protein FRC10_011836 [Ceratobasidium sp. 414]|nr:hypothetical protein FRC10_011836 [Ceratobasidium sp. 414]